MVQALERVMTAIKYIYDGEIDHWCSDSNYFHSMRGFYATTKMKNCCSCHNSFPPPVSVRALKHFPISAPLPFPYNIAVAQEGQGGEEEPRRAKLGSLAMSIEYDVHIRNVALQSSVGFETRLLSLTTTRCRRYLLDRSY